MRKDITKYRTVFSMPNSYPAGKEYIKFSLYNNIGKHKEQVVPIKNCRELLCALVGKFINGKVVSSARPSKKYPVDLERLRLVIHYDNSSHEQLVKFRENLFYGKKMLNIIERQMGWKKSTISTCKMKYVFGNVERGKIVEKVAYQPCWLVTGPKEWMLYSQFLSFATYLLRVVASFGYAPLEEVNNVDDVKEYLTRVSKMKDIRSLSEDFMHDSLMGNDKSFAIPNVRGLEVILRHEEIFGSMTMKQNWGSSSDVLFSSTCGMQTFVNKSQAEIGYNTQVRNAQRKYRTLMEGGVEHEEKH